LANWLYGWYFSRKVCNKREIMHQTRIAGLVLDALKDPNFSRKDLITKKGRSRVNKGLRLLDKLLTEGKCKEDFDANNRSP